MADFAGTLAKHNEETHDEVQQKKIYDYVTGIFNFGSQQNNEKGDLTEGRYHYKELGKDPGKEYGKHARIFREREHLKCDDELITKEKGDPRDRVIRVFYQVKGEMRKKEQDMKDFRYQNELNRTSRRQEDVFEQMKQDEAHKASKDMLQMEFDRNSDHLDISINSDKKKLLSPKTKNNDQQHDDDERDNDDMSDSMKSEELSFSGTYQGS